MEVFKYILCKSSKVNKKGKKAKDKRKSKTSQEKMDADKQSNYMVVFI